MPNRVELQNKTSRYPGVSKTIKVNKRTEAEKRNADYQAEQLTAEAEASPLTME